VVEDCAAANHTRREFLEDPNCKVPQVDSARNMAVHILSKRGVSDPDLAHMVGLTLADVEKKKKIGKGWYDSNQQFKELCDTIILKHFPPLAAPTAGTATVVSVSVTETVMEVTERTADDKAALTREQQAVLVYSMFAVGVESEVIAEAMRLDEEMVAEYIGLADELREKDPRLDNNVNLMMASSRKFWQEATDEKASENKGKKAAKKRKKGKKN
jgi:hypothetical protein